MSETVKDVFKRIYSDRFINSTVEHTTVDIVSCYYGIDCCNKGFYPGPVIIDAHGRLLGYHTEDGVWGHPGGHYPEPCKPDIADRPASAFVGFFGEEFDNAVTPPEEKG